MRTLVLVALAIAPPIATTHAQPAAEMRAQAASIAERYLEIWSGDGAAAVQNVPYVYGPTVQFYGRTYSQAQLMAEKRRAVAQWPIRRYAMRPGTVQVICNEAEMKCGVRSVIDFVAENPVRGTRKGGSARFDLGVSFAGPRPRNPI